MTDTKTREIPAAVNLTPAAEERIAELMAKAPEDAPQPDDPRFARNEVHVVASAAISLEAAAAKAEAAGWPAVILSDAIEGEAREVAKMHGAMAREVVHRNRPFKAPLVMLSGGETTVTLRGKGGRGARVRRMSARAPALSLTFSQAKPAPTERSTPWSSPQNLWSTSRPAVRSRAGRTSRW